MKPRMKPFPVGRLVFVVERRPLELAVWLQGHPERSVTVPVPVGEDYGLLRMTYWREPAPLQVEYNGE